MTPTSPTYRPSLRLWLAAPLFLSAALLLSAPAHADPTPAERRNAATLLAEGKRLMDADKPKEALDKYNAAHALLHSPTTAFAVAEALWQLGQFVEAREMVYRITQRPPSPGEPFSDFKARGDAKLAVGVLDGRIPAVQVRVRGGPLVDVTTTIDGHKLPPSALKEPMRCNPGKHVIVAEAKGYKPARATVELVDGTLEPVVVELNLERIVEQPGQNSNLIYAGVGVTAVLAAAGAGTLGGAFLMKGKADGIQAIQCRPTCGDEHAEFDHAEAQKRMFAVVSLTTFVGAGVVGASTLGYWLATRKKSSETESAPQAALVVTPSSGGLVVSGHW